MPNMDSSNLLDISPEGWSLIKRQHDIDIAESGLKVDFEQLEYMGITLCSRWDVANEYETMKNVVNRLPLSARLTISSIFCDSNATSVYTIALKNSMISRDTQFAIVEAFRRAGGYNGLYFDGETGPLPKDFTTAFGPWWGEDDLGNEDGDERLGDFDF